MPTLRISVNGLTTPALAPTPDRRPPESVMSVESTKLRSESATEKEDASGNQTHALPRLAITSIKISSHALSNLPRSTSAVSWMVRHAEVELFLTPT